MMSSSPKPLQQSDINEGLVHEGSSKAETMHKRHLHKRLCGLMERDLAMN